MLCRTYAVKRIRQAASFKSMCSSLKNSVTALLKVSSGCQKNKKNLSVQKKNGHLLCKCKHRLSESAMTYSLHVNILKLKSNFANSVQPHSSKTLQLQKAQCARCELHVLSWKTSTSRYASSCKTQTMLSRLKMTSARNQMYA